jgi:FAD/FMN-containing dehydrogenase
VEQKISPYYWRHEKLPPTDAGQFLLPHGLGRSYGDSCLNAGHVLVATRGLNRFLNFDSATGILRCEAGISLAEILDVTLPRGWFLPVTPGTKFVTIGGAIANDVHGKNHHAVGSFGHFVRCLELLRSDGRRLQCSPDQNPDWFAATVGGLGLTGLILWAEIQMLRVTGKWIEVETIKFQGLDHFLDLSAESETTHDYLVSWIDCFAGGGARTKGLFMRGNHWQGPEPGAKKTVSQPRLRIPLDAPGFLLNRFTVRAFNFAYYHKQLARKQRKLVHYDPFFYPLDSIHNWNRLYGKRGFLQWQCVVPIDDGRHVINEVLNRIAHAGFGSFLAVLKTMGTTPSLGMLSFPRAGMTLALDFSVRRGVLSLLDGLDVLVRDCGGAVYAAKDARMSPSSFKASYPRWLEFSRFADPGFSSSFWRRVTAIQ